MRPRGYPPVPALRIHPRDSCCAAERARRHVDFVTIHPYKSSADPIDGETPVSDRGLCDLRLSQDSSEGVCHLVPVGASSGSRPPEASETVALINAVRVELFSFGNSSMQCARLNEVPFGWSAPACNKNGSIPVLRKGFHVVWVQPKPGMNRVHSHSSSVT